MTSRRVASWSRARILPRQQVYVTTPPPRSGTALRDELLATCSSTSPLPTPPPRSGTALRDELLATCSLAMAASGETEGAFAQPPQFVLLAVLAKLPADTRMRCAEVSRAWRDAASSPSLWRDIDLTEGSGITIPQFFVVDPWMRCRGANDAVLRAAAARAQGELQALRIACSGRTSLEALSSILATNARTLRKLCIRGYLHRLRQTYQKEMAVITALLHAAPALEELELDLAMRIKALEPSGSVRQRAVPAGRRAARHHGLRHAAAHGAHRPRQRTGRPRHREAARGAARRQRSSGGADDIRRAGRMISFRKLSV
jgi:hypothetical protein